MCHDGLEINWNSLVFRECSNIVPDLDGSIHVDIGQGYEPDVYLLASLVQAECIPVESESCMFDEVSLVEFLVLLLLGNVDVVITRVFVGTRGTGGETRDVFEDCGVFVFHPSSVHLFSYSAGTNHHNQRYFGPVFF